MTTFDKREEGFEKKFALDEEQKFKAMPVRIVGAAAGRITVKARLTVPTSSVRATLIHSLRTAATPNAVLSSIGHTEQMKITKIAEMLESLMV